MARLATVVLLVVAVLGGCTGGSDPTSGPGATPTAIVTPTTEPTAVPTAEPTAEPTADYSLGRFGPPPVEDLPESVALALQSAIDAAAEGSVPGLSATVVVAGQGTWSGAAGTSDGADPIEVGSTFGIASITKTVIAAQVLRLHEMGLLELDDPVAAHLPDDFDFDANGATILNLLSMESGIPDPQVPLSALAADPAATWTARQVLATVPAARRPPGQSFVYEDANFMLLAMVIEQVTGQSTAAALRSGVLAGASLATLVYQPEEKPALPVALPFGGSKMRELFDAGQGYLPFRAAAGEANASGAMASDARALAQFGYLLYGHDMLSADSLGAMTDFGADRYGIGTFNQTSLADGFAVTAVGNAGWDDRGYTAALTVLPSEGIVIALLTNSGQDPVAVAFPVVQQLAAVLDDGP